MSPSARGTGPVSFLRLLASAAVASSPELYQRFRLAFSLQPSCRQSRVCPSLSPGAGMGRWACLQAERNCHFSGCLQNGPLGRDTQCREQSGRLEPPRWDSSGTGFKTRSLLFAILQWGQIFITWEGVWDLAITKSPGVPRAGNWAMTGQAVPLVRPELCSWFLLSVSVPQWEFPKCSGAKAEPCLSAVPCVSGPV